MIDLTILPVKHYPCQIEEDVKRLAMINMCWLLSRKILSVIHEMEFLI